MRCVGLCMLHCRFSVTVFKEMFSSASLSDSCHCCVCNVGLLSVYCSVSHVPTPYYTSFLPYFLPSLLPSFIPLVVACILVSMGSLLLLCEWNVLFFSTGVREKAYLLIWYTCWTHASRYLNWGSFVHSTYTSVGRWSSGNTWSSMHCHSGTFVMSTVILAYWMERLDLDQGVILTSD